MYCYLSIHIQCVWDSTKLCLEREKNSSWVHTQEFNDNLYKVLILYTEKKNHSGPVKHLPCNSLNQ